MLDRYVYQGSLMLVEGFLYQHMRRNGKVLGSIPSLEHLGLRGSSPLYKFGPNLQVRFLTSHYEHE